MPSLIRPELPPEVEAAISFMGNRAQADILRHLSLLGPSTIGRLQSAATISRPSLNRHLDSLATAGLVQTDPPAGMRHGKDVTYTAQPARIRNWHTATSATSRATDSGCLGFRLQHVMLQSLLKIFQY